MLYIYIYKPQQLGGLSPSWAVASHKNDPATKYSLTPKLTHWVFSRAVMSSIKFCSSKNYVFLVLEDEIYEFANINVIKNVRLVVVVIVSVVVVVVVA